MFMKERPGKVQYLKDMTVISPDVDEVDTVEKPAANFIDRLQNNYAAGKLRAQMRGHVVGGNSTAVAPHICNFWKIGLQKDFGGRVLIRRTCADIAATGQVPGFTGCKRHQTVDILPEAQARELFRKLRAT